MTVNYRDIFKYIFHLVVARTNRSVKNLINLMDKSRGDRCRRFLWMAPKVTFRIFLNSKILAFSGQNVIHARIL